MITESDRLRSLPRLPGTRRAIRNAYYYDRLLPNAARRTSESVAGLGAEHAGVPLADHEPLVMTVAVPVGPRLTLHARIREYRTWSATRSARCGWPWAFRACRRPAVAWRPTAWDGEGDTAATSRGRLFCDGPPGTGLDHPGGAFPALDQRLVRGRDGVVARPPARCCPAAALSAAYSAGVPGCGSLGRSHVPARALPGRGSAAPHACQVSMIGI